VMTAIGKRAVAGRRAVGPLGIDGDEQADPAVHGGPSKAVYAYPIEHYPFWQTVRAQAGAAAWDEALPPGALGENLTVEGVVESAVFIGDVLRFPDCALAVSEPRFPCFKLNAAMGFKHAGKLLVQSAWCGWYLAVREPGTIAAGETFVIEPGPREVGIGELFRARMGRP
jgi:MOSC domain-containing protein YiiM